jgi:cytochrome P450
VSSSLTREIPLISQPYLDHYRGAGADTTSVGMSACLYYLGTHPDAYQRLQREIDQFYESQCLTEPITYHQTQQIPFLKAVVSEALRLFPSIMYQLLRVSPGIVIAKQYIPAGYDIGISPIAQNRDQAVFGPDADEFRPERWLESDKVVAGYERSNMTFGGNGPRTCVGRNIALVSITLSVIFFKKICG